MKPEIEKSEKIMLNGDSATEILNLLSKFYRKGTDATIEILLLDCDQLSINECLTISNLLTSIQDKFEIQTFSSDVTVKQLILLSSVGRDKRTMQSTSSILLKSNNMTKDEIDSVCKHLSQPSKSKYVVEDLNKDIQTGKILDAKEIKKMKFCVKFKGETPKRKKPLKPSSSSKSDKDDSDVKRKAEEETNQKDKDEYSNDEKDDDKNAKNKKSKKLKTAVTIDKK